MFIRRLSFLLPLLVILTMLVSLVTPAVVLAAGEPPPPASEKPPKDTKTGSSDKPAPPSSISDITYTADLPTAAPLTAPDGLGAVNPLELTVEAIANAGAVLVDENGKTMPLASQNVVNILSAFTDPYFKGVGGSSCDLLTGFCTFDTIQQAVDNFIALTGSGPIYAPSSWAELTGVNVNNITKLTGLVWDGGGINQQYSPYIKGNVTINTMASGFKLDGFTIEGGIITNNTGSTLRFQNLEIKNVSGDGIHISDHKGNVDLFNVYSHDNQGYGAYIDTTLGTGSVSITNSFFLNNLGPDGLKINTKGSIKLEGVEASNQNNGNGAELTFGKGATILNSSFNYNHGDGLFVNNGVGTLTLTNVTASNNSNAAGANINNNLDVSITGSLFSENSIGVLVTSTLGSITLNGVTSIDNPNGSSLNNYAASTYKKVTITRSVFQGSDTGSGLSILSKGGVTLNHVVASGNRDDGVNIDNCQDDPVLTCKNKSIVTISNSLGTNDFNENNGVGLVINSGGNVTLAGIIATAKTGTGGTTITTNGNVSISKSQFNDNLAGYGLKVVNKGTILLDKVTALRNLSNGALLDNSGAITLYALTINSSQFNTNQQTGLVAKSRGNINLNYVDASFNKNVDKLVNVEGANLDNGLGGGSISISNSLGTNYFNNNNNNGLYISSRGSVKMVGVNANENGGYGTKLPYDSFLGISAKTVSIQKSNFSTNIDKGLEVKARGDITLNNVTADNSKTGSQGASLDNCLFITPAPLPPLSPCKGTGNVNVLNSSGNNSFSNNYGTGLYIDSSGIVTVNGTTASNNPFGSGLQITNNYLPVNTKSVNINQSFFSNNYGNGLGITSNGTITLNTVISNNNGGFGAILMNEISPKPSGGVVIANKYGVNQFNSNGNEGLFITTNGLVTLTKVTTNFNGLVIPSSGINITTTRNVTITCSSMQWNTKNGLEVYLNPLAPATATLYLKSVAANQNDLLHTPRAWDISLTGGTLNYSWTNCGY